jgi:hypothetical protein
MPESVFSKTSGRRAARRATPSTISRVLAGGPATATTNGSARPSGTCSAPLSREYSMQPPHSAAAASMPDGLP